VLTQEEQSHFEESMAVLAAAEYCEHKTVSYWCTLRCMFSKIIASLNIHICKDAIIIFD